MIEPRMSTEERQRLRNLRVAIAQHFEDAASLYEQLPKGEHDRFLSDAATAWSLVAREPLTEQQLIGMVETLFRDEDDEEPISATQSPLNRERPEE